MSIEGSVRERQEFERAAREYLSVLSALTTDELEVSLARIADRLIDCDEEAMSLALRMRGLVLKLYFDLRKSGLRKQRRAKRVGLRPSLRTYRQDLGDADARRKHNERMDKYRREEEKHAERCREWDIQRKEHGWWQRLLDARPLPPDRPRFVSQAKPVAVDFSEFLIETAASFDLSGLSSNLDDLKESDIELLSE